MSLVASLAAIPLAATLALGGSGTAIDNTTNLRSAVDSSKQSITLLVDASASAGRILPMHTKKQCDREMNAGAKICSRLRPIQAAAICHAANMARYAGCLAGASG